MRRLARPWTRGAILAALLAPAAAAAQDSDGDGVADVADAYPCDAAAAGQVFVPGENQHGALLMEDHWPARADLDFNDMVLSHNVAIRTNAAGQALSLRAVFNAVAIGGTFQNGLGWRLPVPRGQVSSIRRTLFGGATQTLTPSATDADATVVLSTNLRELFANRQGAINSIPSEARVAGQVMIVEVDFATPVTLPTAAAPWDLFMFRSATRGHEIHRPEYAGTSVMAAELFGTEDDGSAGSRYFVDDQGLPFVLVFPTLVNYPPEFVPIHDLYPNILQFASSGGTSSQNFYTVGVNPGAAFANPSAPALPAPAAINRSCVPTLAANGDAVSVVQGEQLTIPFSTLLANDTAGSGGGSLTIVSVSDAVGGTASISSTNVLFRSTGFAGQAARFNYVMRNSLGHQASASVTVTVTPLPAVQALMVDTAADLQLLTTSGTGYVPPTQQEIFNTWQRFSHGVVNSSHTGHSNAINVSSSDMQSWIYNSTLGSVQSTVNTPTYIGFLSPETLTHYTMEVTVSADSTGGDNDTIGVVIAYVTDGVRQYTLSALRNRAPGEAHGYVGSTDTRWAIALNYAQLDERLVANGSATAGGGGNWNGTATQTRIRISRQGDLISVATSQYGSTTIDAATTLSVDLSQSADLARFRGPAAWGLSAHSQARAYYQNLQFFGGLNASVIHDISVSPARVWDYATSTGWTVRPSATPQSVLGCPRRVDRPAVTTVSPQLPALSFQLDCDTGYRL